MAFEEVYFDGSEYVLVKRAALVLGKTEDYVKNLSEEGKISSKQVGDDLFISVDSLNNFSGEGSEGADLVKVLPSKSAVAILALTLSVFVYYNFFGVYQNSYVSINKATSIVGTYGAKVAGASESFVISLSNFTGVGEAGVLNSVASYDPTIVLKQTTKIPGRLASLWASSYVDLNIRTIDFYRNIYRNVFSQFSDFSIRFVGSPVGVAHVWRDSYIDLHYEGVDLYFGAIDSIKSLYKDQLSGPIEDAGQGLLVLSSAKVDKNQTANILDAAGDLSGKVILNVKVKVKQTSLLLSDLMGDVGENWADFIGGLFNISEETNTEINIEESLNEDIIREIIRQELEDIIGGVTVTPVNEREPFSVDNVNEGLAVFPAPVDAISQEELIKKIQSSFSDRVSVELDESGRAGIIRTSLLGDDQDYIFVITPVNPN